MRPEHLLTRPKRRPRRQDIVDQHHTFRQRSSPMLTHPKRAAKGRQPAARVALVRDTRCLRRHRSLGLDLTAPPLGQPLRQGLGRVEATTHMPSPMQRHGDEHDVPRRGGHPWAIHWPKARPWLETRRISRDAPRGACQDATETPPQTRHSRPAPGRVVGPPRCRASSAKPIGRAGTSPPPRWAPRAPTAPTSTQSPSQIHAPPRCDACHAMCRVFCVRPSMLRGCRAL